MSELTKDMKEQIKRRRTFAIISHPDAGKTTLTENSFYMEEPSIRQEV